MMWWLLFISSLVIGYLLMLVQKNKILKILNNRMAFHFPKLEISPAGKNQFHEIFNLLKIATIDLKSREINQWSYWLDPPKEKLDWIKNGHQKGEFYFITMDDEILGMYRLSTEDLLYWGKQQQASYFIHSLIVHPKYKGLKIGAYILKEIEYLAQKNDIHLLRLDCDASNKNLCKYYLNQGFVKVNEKQMKLSLNNLYEKKI